MYLHKVTSPDYSSVLSPDSSTDLGSATVDTQTAINGVIEWAVMHNIFYVCNILIDMDLTDTHTLGTSKAYMNLLTGCKTFTFNLVAHYQELMNTCNTDADIESSTWPLNVLTTEMCLLVQVKQSFDKLRDA